MDLHFLGTGGGRPCKERNVTSIMLDMPDASGALLFDCGEGTQHQMLRASVKLSKISKIFITHLHSDHLFGLPGLLISRSMNQVATPLTIYGPAGIAEFITVTLRISGSRILFPFDVVEIEAGEIADNDDYRVLAWPLTHTIECYGYRVEQKDKPGALDAARLEAERVPRGPWFHDLKKGRQITLGDGRIVRGRDYLTAGQKGKTLAIFGDTTPCSASLLLAKGVDVMVHEATLEVALEAKAREHGHSTTAQAACVARDAGAKRLIITHLSSRYQRQDSEYLLAECRAIFPATEMAFDFSRFTV